MMKPRTIISCVIALAAGLAANAVPVVSDVTMTQDPGTALVTVKCRLSGDPGVITMDIQTNYTDGAETKWASIGPANMCGFGGDVHQVVQPTGEGEYRSIYWSPEVYWPGPPRIAGTARAVVTAWATNAPPDYMVVHLISPYDVTYYPYKEMVPGGITNIMYKGEYMAFRKIPAKGVVWMAGFPTNHANYAADCSCPHRVMLTDDYYMGVFEVTAAQTAAIDAGEPTAVRTPKTWWSLQHYRGSAKGLQWPSYTNGEFDYEKSHEVDPTSRCGKLRERTGLAFDLPTEHQWEYACRAGSPGTVYTDTLPTLGLPANLQEQGICRYATNKGGADCEGLTGNAATVGSYEPNAWGLYDMLGNVHEVCLDWNDSWATLYPDTTKTYVDPVGPEKGSLTQVVYRGGDYETTSGTGKWGITIGWRTSRAWNDVWGTEGTRLCVTLH